METLPQNLVRYTSYPLKGTNPIGSGRDKNSLKKESAFAVLFCLSFCCSIPAWNLLSAELSVAAPWPEPGSHQYPRQSVSGPHSPAAVRLVEAYLPLMAESGFPVLYHLAAVLL